MMLPGYCLMAAASAKLIAFPELVGATTSTMFAPGAMAWAYSTSKLVSTAQPNHVMLGAIGIERWAPIFWTENGERRRGRNVEDAVEDGQIVLDRRAAEGIHDQDG